MGLFSRPVYIGLCVLFLHAAVLWCLQVDSKREVAAPPILLVQIPSTQLPPASQPLPLLQPQTIKPPTPKTQPISRTDRQMAPVPKSPPPVAIEASPPPASVEDTVKTLNSNPGPALATSPTTGTTHPATNRKDPAAAAMPQNIQLPSNEADYLNNPPPIFPAISLRLGERGRVLVHVLIEKDGGARQGEIKQSSGFERLDQAALRAALTWHYVPGRRNGIAQDMWYDIPVDFVTK